MKEKLIEILKNTPPTRIKFVGRMVGKTYTTLSGVAEHLIANDVVKVVRCENCAYANENKELSDMCDCRFYRDMRKKTDFCNYGTRRES